MLQYSTTNNSPPILKKQKGLEIADILNFNIIQLAHENQKDVERRETT